jgi:hypothetical protein
MKNSSAFSYTLSAFVLLAVVSLLAGYYMGRNQKTPEGFASEGFANSPCNVCGQPKPACGCAAPKPKRCPPAQKCPMCSGCKPTCGCPQSAPGSAGASKVPPFVEPKAVGPEAMNQAIAALASGLPANCPAPKTCPMPDATKYVLKSTIPPCPPMPDMTRYMLKTECPSQPDMSKYVLKSSVPKCPPCISTCSKPCKIGECPPCPRPRCPTPNCPEPKPCPACPAVQVAACPEPRVQCKAAYEPPSTVRPMLASTSQFGL